MTDSPKPPSRWPALMVGAVIFLVLSLAVLVLSLANALQGASGEQASLAGPIPTETARATPAPTSPGSPNPSATKAPVGTLLPCGDILVPIDKEHSLASDCAPKDLAALPDNMAFRVDFPIVLRAEAAAAFRDMFEAARKDGYTLVVRSAYRSYQQQAQTFDANVAAGGMEYALRTSARAGHSEHQLGTAADVTSASNGYGLEGFEDTREAKWVAENCVKFGFVLSYPEGKEQVTGYAYEAWHIRYVGKDTAAKVQSSGLTLREFLLR